MGRGRGVETPRGAEDAVVFHSVSFDAFSPMRHSWYGRVITTRRFFRCHVRKARPEMTSVTTTRTPNARQRYVAHTFSLFPAHYWPLSTRTARAAFPRRMPRVADARGGRFHSSAFRIFHETRRFGDRNRFARFARAMSPVEDAVVSFEGDRRESHRARIETRRLADAFLPSL